MASNLLNVPWQLRLIGYASGLWLFLCLDLWSAIKGLGSKTPWTVFCTVLRYRALWNSILYLHSGITRNVKGCCKVEISLVSQNRALQNCSGCSYMDDCIDCLATLWILLLLLFLLLCLTRYKVILELRYHLSDWESLLVQLVRLNKDKSFLLMAGAYQENLEMWLFKPGRHFAIFMVIRPSMQSYFILFLK